MTVVDWRELYAQNQSAISESGIPLSAMTPAPLFGMTAPAPQEIGQHRATHPLRARRPLISPRRQPSRSAPARAREPRTDPPALVHIPPGLDPAVPAAVVCMLHGCTQDPVSFAAATAMNETANRHGFIVVYPAQPRGRNAQRCWNWFMPTHQQRGAGEPALIAGITQDLVHEQSAQKVDSQRLFVAGLSSGGAMALILTACYPDLFAAVAVHSGLPYRSAHDLTSAFAAMRDAGGNRHPDGQAIHAAMGEHARPVPSLVIHGTADRTVAPGNAQHILAQSMQANHLAAPRSCAHHPAKPSSSHHARADGGLHYTHRQWLCPDGTLMHESIEVQNLEHAWSGGVPGASHTDPRGPSATEAIWTFFTRAARAPSQAQHAPPTP
jgi:poly(hydroxyalkanoate) depolymerase family esterase